MEECRSRNLWNLLLLSAINLHSTPPNPKPCSLLPNVIASPTSNQNAGNPHHTQCIFLSKIEFSQQKGTLLRLWLQNWYHSVFLSLQRKRNSPSPDRYTLTSDFQQSPKKGLTIGHSREDCKSISIFNQNNHPGPGNYNLDKQNVKDVTMSPKLKFPSLWSSSFAPGPGKCKTNIM